MRRGVLLAAVMVIGVVVGPGAELGEFVAVGVGLAFGVLGPGSQVGAQFVPVTGGVGAEGSQHLVRVAADPAGLSPGGVLGGLCAGGFLLGQPGSRSRHRIFRDVVRGPAPNL